MNLNLLALMLFTNKLSAYYTASSRSMSMLLHNQVDNMHILNMAMNLATSLSTFLTTVAAPAIYSVIEFQHPFISRQDHCIEQFV